MWNSKLCLARTFRMVIEEEDRTMRRTSQFYFHFRFSIDFYIPITCVCVCARGNLAYSVAIVPGTVANASIYVSFA